MRRLIGILFFFFICKVGTAGKIFGKVTTENGTVLPFSSITVQQTNYGTLANNEGVYFLELNAGTYTIICQHVGYERREQRIQVRANDSLELNFVLSAQKVSLQEIVIKPGSEDPAYAMIRSAIKKRKEHLEEHPEYVCDVYSKGVLNLRDFPLSFLGQKVDFEDGDTSKRKMIYLSETVSRLSKGRGGDSKIEVLSSRVSGQSDGYGLAGASFFSFYQNNVQISNSLNPRGFVSPISDRALQYYRYRYEGAFSEGGVLINRIRVFPKRKYEPLFSGVIQLVEDEWRIHSIQLMLTKENQMQLADTLRIEQLYHPHSTGEWVMQSQVLYPSIRFMGFDAYGSFSNVYRTMNLHPKFEKGFFNRIVLTYQKGSNQRPLDYWDSIRPLPLTREERTDYLKKDSLEQRRKDPAYLDSIDRIQNRVKPVSLLITGKTLNWQRTKTSLELPAMIQVLGFNTVEGAVLDVPVKWMREFKNQKRLVFSPHIRYGFTSRTVFGWGTVRYASKSDYGFAVAVSGGKRVFQFNNDNPIEPLQNTISSLLYKNNFMKLYAAAFARISFSKGVGHGLSVYGSLQYQDRSPLQNRTDYSWTNRAKPYTVNYPDEFSANTFVRHQAFFITGGINWQPGAGYISLPDRMINTGSKWPIFTLQYKKGIQHIAGSDVDFDQWMIRAYDQVNLKLAGRFDYKVQAGGFINATRTELPDMQHFPGNRLYKSTDFLSTFQLISYYTFSNTANRSLAFFGEHHFNGLLTNKIPVFKSLNWNLVAGGSCLLYPSVSYAEWHVGFENIFRFFRVDLVSGYLNGRVQMPEYRIGTSISIGSSAD